MRGANGDRKPEVPRRNMFALTPTQQVIGGMLVMAAVGVVIADCLRSNDDAEIDHQQQQLEAEQRERMENIQRAQPAQIKTGIESCDTLNELIARHQGCPSKAIAERLQPEIDHGMRLMATASSAEAGCAAALVWIVDARKRLDCK